MKAKKSLFVGLGALLVLIVAVGLVFASDAPPTEEPAGSPFFDATLQQAVDELDGKARPPGLYQQPPPGTQHYTTDVSVWPECEFGFTRDLVQWPWCHYTSDPSVQGCDTPWPTQDYTWDSEIWADCDPTGVGITQDPAKFWCDPLWTKDPGVVQCDPRYTTDPGQWPWCNPRFTWDPAQWPGICQPGVPYTHADIWPECNMQEFTTDPYRWAECHYTSDPMNPECLPQYPTQDYTSNPAIWPECPAPEYTLDPGRWPWCDPQYTIDWDRWPECRQTGPYTYNPAVWPWCDPQYTLDTIWPSECHFTSDPVTGGPCAGPWPTKDYTWDFNIWPECDNFTTNPDVSPWCLTDPPYTQDTDEWPWCSPAWTWDQGMWNACQPGYTNDPGTWPECDTAKRYTQDPTVWDECEFYTADARIWPECHLTSDPTVTACSDIPPWPTKDYTTDLNLWPECDAPPEYTSDPAAWPECHYTSDPKTWTQCLTVEPGDLGDAPDSTNHTAGALMTAYPSGGPLGVQANFPSVFDPATGLPQGPMHWSPRIAWLGKWVTLEHDADLMPDEDGLTNIDPPVDVPDRDAADDGLLHPLRLPHCQTTWISATVTVTPGVGTVTQYLNVWLDFNRDGDWADTLTCPDGSVVYEWAVQDLLFVFGPGTAIVGKTFLSYNPPPVQPIWMRITLSDVVAPRDSASSLADGRGPPAGYGLGETEDYYLPGETLADLGDAPDRTNHPGVPMTAYPPGGPPGVPANFPVVFDPATGLPPGPKHWSPRTDAWLGPKVTLEDDADLMPDEDAVTNIDPQVDTPDRDVADDGVLFPVPMPHCVPSVFSYTVTIPAGAASIDRYVNVWFDWNGDGDWADFGLDCPGVVAGEWAVQNQVIPAATPPGVYVFQTPQYLPWHPQGHEYRDIWMRISIAEQRAPGPEDGRGPRAGYQHGETEDYYLPAEEALADLGDAPDSTNHAGVSMTAYPPGGPPGVLANFPSVFDPATGLPQGPKHWNPRADSWLGPWVTLEDDADLMPDEDGLTNIDPPVDKPDLDVADDGLLYPVRLPHCQSTVISVTLTVTPGGATGSRFLNVWLDFNRDGDWGDSFTCPGGAIGDEWAVKDQIVSVGPGTHVVTLGFRSYNPPPAQPIWMRITLSDVVAPRSSANSLADGRGPAGGYAIGETEDYYLPGEASGDLGDAPDSTNHPGAPMTAYPAGGPPGVPAGFPSVFDLATGGPPGPKHWSPRADAWLGPWVTLEDDADLMPDEDAVTNIDPQGDMPDRDAADDGVLFPVPMPHCVPSVFRYTVTIPPGAAGIDRYVNVWFDWTGDGDWADMPNCDAGPAPILAPEWAVQNQVIPAALAPGVYVFQTPQYLPWHPQGSEDRDIWMRISIAEQRAPSPQDGRGPRTGYQYGETEDYYLAQQGEEYDIYIKDSDLDDGSVPSPLPFWVSPDIWTRNDGDCSQTASQNPIPGQPTTVCVRVRNRMATAVQNITVNNYYANASLGLVWPASWSYLGTFNIPALAPSAEQVMSVPWNVPLLAAHFCLLSRADALKDPLPTGPDTTPPVDYTRNNNNIAQRNLFVVQYPKIEGCRYYTTTVDTDTVEFDVVNTFSKVVDVDVEFDSADFPLGAGTITVEPASLWMRWASLTNLSIVGPTTLEVTGFPARMEDISMTASEMVRVTMNVSAEIDERFSIQVTEYISDTEIGGVEYVRDLPFCLYLPIITKD